MQIRDAIDEDASSACQVLRRSITELCVADHGNSPEILAAWLGNKHAEAFISWIRPGNSVLVAVEDGDILAVGSVTDAGMITLNYVSPDARFRGVSKAILASLETRAVKRGNNQCKLHRTVTARRFYRSYGYVEAAASVRLFGISGYPMSKALTAVDSK